MNCEGVRAVLDKGYSATTLAERNAACVHCRACEACQQMLVDCIGKIPPSKLPGEAIAAALALAKDRSDPEWE